MATASSKLFCSYRVLIGAAAALAGCDPASGPVAAPFGPDTGAKPRPADAGVPDTGAASPSPVAMAMPTPAADAEPTSDAGAPETPAAEEPVELVPPDRAARVERGCPAETGEARVLFDIPRAGDVSNDFYRLPFPSDARRRDGRIVLADFPRPTFVLSDVVDRVVRAIEAEKLGFSPNPVVTFRLSRAIGEKALAAAAAPGVIRFVDLSKGTPEYGQVIPHRLGTSGGGIYVCPNHLVVTRKDPAPLRGGHTYAVVITSALTDERGEAFGRDADFGVMLASTAPDGNERRAAWQAHAPLRTWLKSGALDARKVIAAAVFTVDEVDRPVAALRAAVRASAAPEVKDLVRCGPGVVSACDDGRSTACGAVPEDAPFVEYQGRLVIPTFQQGTPPFESSGGLIAFEDGIPQVARREPVCFALTVPKTSAGTRGFPLVVYGHGTGGNYRWPSEAGLADELARGADGVAMATLSFDGVLHGPRKGASARGTDELVYNVFNPTAARDNGLQAAADLFAFARALPLLVATDRKLDLRRVALYGHSQGGNAAALAGGYEPDFGAVVLSGTGGGIATSLLAKEKPVAARSFLPLLVGESVADPSHPVLALMQLYFDRADPLNHGRRIAAGPMTGLPARHLLHVYGAADRYAPDATQLAFAIGAELPVLRPVTPLPALGPLPLATAPVRANLRVGSGAVTALSAQYLPDGYDGHFVGTHNASARAAIREFLTSYFRDGVPAVN